MKIADESFFKALREFLTVFLPKQKCCSKTTVESYKTALNLFVDYLTQAQKIPMSQLSFSHLNSKNINGFLDELQVQRGIGASTRNQRLMALRSFIKFAAISDVENLSLLAEIQKIPTQKQPPKMVEFLSEEAFKTLLMQPDSSSSKGMRNLFFMVLMYDTAGRCQEMLDLRLCDFELNLKNPFVYLKGKGGKTRAVPIMEKTVQHLNRYLEEFHPIKIRTNDDLLFYTVIHGQRQQMSQDTVALFMKKYGVAAKLICSSVPDRVHPHQLRHTRAIHLYRNGFPMALLAEFLGHVNVSTTQVYAYADTEMKRLAIQKATSTSVHDEPPVWKDDKELIKKLYGLA